MSHSRKIRMCVLRYTRYFILVAMFVCSLQSTLPSRTTEETIELKPLIFDDPSVTILPVAFFIEPDGGFAVIDAGSNSSRIKVFTEDGNILTEKLPSFSTENSTTPGMISLNPFGIVPWSGDGDGTIFLLEDRPAGRVLRGISVSKDWDIELPNDTDFRLVLNNTETPLFDAGGLANLKGKKVVQANLAGYTKVTVDEDGNIFAISERQLSKFNPYGIPQWSRQFPDEEDGSYLPISFTTAGGSVTVAGILLPPGLSVDEFLSNYELSFALNPDLSPQEIFGLFQYLATDGTPLLISYATLDGELESGMELNECPIWVSANSRGDIYLLYLSPGGARIARVAPDFSEDLTIFEIECGERELEGVTKIAVADGYIYHDLSEFESSEYGTYRDRLSIVRHPLEDPSKTEVFASKPYYDGGYFVAGLKVSKDGTVYVAGSKFSFSPGGEVESGGPFLDAYDRDGSFKLNFLDGANPAIIPNDLAMGMESDILLAIADESGTLSTSWAFRFSEDGRLLGEFFYLGAGGINEINMVAGGTIGVTDDGTIYQCDNLRFPDSDKPYMRKFDPKGKYIGDLRKYCNINAGLMGVVDGHPIMLWQNRYLLMLDDDDVVAYADLGGHFETVEATEITTDGDSLYLLATDGVIYEMPMDDGWDSESFLLVDVESAAEALRGIILSYSASHGSPPEKVDDEFWDIYAGYEGVDDLMEPFFGPGPFDYSVSGRLDFTFYLFGKDPYQTVYLVSRDGVEEIY